MKETLDYPGHHLPSHVAKLISSALKLDWSELMYQCWRRVTACNPNLQPFSEQTNQKKHKKSTEFFHLSWTGQNRKWVQVAETTWAFVYVLFFRVYRWFHSFSLCTVLFKQLNERNWCFSSELQWWALVILPVSVCLKDKLGNWWRANLLSNHQELTFLSHRRLRHFHSWM